MLEDGLHFAIALVHHFLAPHRIGVNVADNDAVFIVLVGGGHVNVARQAWNRSRGNPRGGVFVAQVRLSIELAVSFGDQLAPVDVEFFVRSASEWESIVARNPFRNEAKRDPGHLVAVFLKDSPDRTRAAALHAAIVGRETARVDGREAYIVFPDGIGRSRLTSMLIEKALGTRGTARNWNTVLKLGSLMAAI